MRSSRLLRRKATTNSMGPSCEYHGFSVTPVTNISVAEKKMSTDGDFDINLQREPAKYSRTRHHLIALSNERSSRLRRQLRTFYDNVPQVCPRGLKWSGKWSTLIFDLVKEVFLLVGSSPCGSTEKSLVIRDRFFCDLTRFRFGGFCTVHQVAELVCRLSILSCFCSPQN